MKKLASKIKAIRKEYDLFDILLGIFLTIMMTLSTVMYISLWFI